MQVIKTKKSCAMRRLKNRTESNPGRKGGYRTNNGKRESQRTVGANDKRRWHLRNTNTQTCPVVRLVVGHGLRRENPNRRETWSLPHHIIPLEMRHDPKVGRNQGSYGAEAPSSPSMVLRQC